MLIQGRFIPSLQSFVVIVIAVQDSTSVIDRINQLLQCDALPSAILEFSMILPILLGAKL
jgi:hypothetical protein